MFIVASEILYNYLQRTYMYVFWIKLFFTQVKACALFKTHLMNILYIYKKSSNILPLHVRPTVPLNSMKMHSAKFIELPTCYQAKIYYTRNNFFYPSIWTLLCELAPGILILEIAPVIAMLLIWHRCGCSNGRKNLQSRIPLFKP